MDLNTALMESINSMSEYFVAANTRTSFTDLAETGSLNSLAGHSTPGNSSISNQSSSNLNLVGQQQIKLDRPNQVPPTISNNNINNHIMDSANSVSQTSNKVSSANTSSQLLQQHQRLQQQNTNNASNQNNNVHHNNHRINNNNNNDISTSLHSSTSSMLNHGQQNSLNTGFPSRLSQPTRTQIPIHCYIEQMDAYADVSGSNLSTLNDSDLFNTVNFCGDEGDSIITNNKSSVQTHIHQPHLHQSKLALESVTNCDGISTLGLLANSGSLFNENETSNNVDNPLNDVDGNLNHLDSDSPLSMLQQTITPSSSSTSSNNINNINNSCNTQLNSIYGNSDVHRQDQTYENDHFETSSRETYAIITSNVLFIDLVRTVLLQLGYSTTDLINAKATIQIKNWRALALDQVTDDKTATVGEVLGDISTFVTLRIRIYSSVTQAPTEWTETMIRQVVLALTQSMSQLTLSKLCNISQPLISAIVRGGKKLGRRKCAEFGQWYANYIKSPDARPPNMFSGSGVGGARLVFDKSREIPQLKAWFATNTNPTDEILEEYSKILNEQGMRKCRPPVTAKALKNWWKNERQKLGIRQREIRGRPKLKRIDFDP